MKSGVLTHIEQLPGLKNSWRELEHRFNTPLLTFEWFSAAAESFSHPDEIEIHFVEDEGKVTAIAPLGKKASFPTLSELIGSSILCEPGGFLYSSLPAFQSLLNSIFESNQSLFFKGLPLEGPESTQLLELADKESYRIYQQIEKIPKVEMQGNWDEFESQHLSSSRRSSFRRLHKKAVQHNRLPLTLEIVPATPETFDSLLLDFIEIEAESWKGRTRTAVLYHTTTHHFFRTYGKKRHEEGEFLFFFLKSGDKRVAGQFTEVYANRLWIYKIGHREGWQFCSPGILLMNEVVKFSFLSGHTSCEFLGSNERWLHIWANAIDYRLTLWMYPKTWIGKVGRARDLARQLWHNGSHIAAEILHR